MSSRLIMLTVVVPLAAAATAATLSMVGHHHRAAVPGNAPLHAYGARAALAADHPGRAKLDGTLTELAAHATRLDPTTLRAGMPWFNPAARFKLAADGRTTLVAIDAVTRGNSADLEQALVALGLQHPAVFSNDVGGWLPVKALTAAAQRAEVHSLRAALSRTRAGAVASQGDFVQNSAALRTTTALTGAGVGVGVLSDSYDCYAVYAAPGSGVPVSGYAGYASNGFTAAAATDISTGDLPATVTLVPTPNNPAEGPCLNYGAPIFPPLADEGRAMLQVVHDVAPGAKLSFHTADNSEADFANGILALASAGAKVVADDVGYFDEPFYQDGIIAQAIDQVEARGVAYFSAAGNDADASYENLAPSFGTLAAAGSANAGEYLLNFDASGATVTTALPVTIDALEPGQFLAVIVEWDQPYVTGAPNSGGATSQLNVCVTGATSEYTVLDYANNPATCSGVNAVGTDPYQILIIANPASATTSTPLTTLNLVIGLANGTTAPGRVKVVVATDGQADPPITQFATHSPTLQGHAGAAGGAAVGAAFYVDTPACGTTPVVLESFSSLGGTPILFDVNGVRLATPVTRQKPDVTGPDGVNDTFLGFKLSTQPTTTITACQNDASHPNFFGTSAATPHVAGIAALMLQANPALTPTQIVTAMQTTALPVALSANSAAGPAPNDWSGYGFVQADLAFAALPPVPPPAPTLTLGATAIVTGSSTTVTWSAVNASGCSATGSWSGAQAVSGSETLTPTTAGTDTYTLTCANAAGASAAATATLTVTAPPPPPSHGGGGLDGAALTGLTALLAGRAYRMRRTLLRTSPSAV